MTSINERNQFRKELINLMRGFYTLPLILSLHKSEILDKLSSKKYTNIKNINVRNKFFLEKVLDYLVALNLFLKNNQSYKITKFGTRIFKRIGTFYILNSYNKIPLNFKYNLTMEKSFRSWCERNDNILGSGLIHQKKFFMPGIKLSQIKNKNIIFDIGCGNGTFLNLVKNNNRSIQILGCDLSNTSVHKTKENLKIQKRDYIFAADGANVDYLKKKLDDKKINLDKNSLISMWFLLHEISDHSKKTLIKYLKKIKKAFPYTPILIGEISSLTNEEIKAHNKISILPEFKLFHELSGQGLLTEKEYLTIFNRSNYKVKKFVRTDKLKFNGISSSSNFVCLIEPKQ